MSETAASEQASAGHSPAIPGAPGVPGAPRAGVSRAEFFRPIHEALERRKTQAPTEPAPAVADPLARLAGPEDDLVTMFASRAILVGMHVRRLRVPDLNMAVLEVLTQAKAKKLALSTSLCPAASALPEMLAAKGYALHDWQAAAGLDAQFDLDAGITDVQGALAETGTLICCSSPNHSRGLSLLPPLHIALLPASAILPDMIDYWATLAPLSSGQMPSSICFITGPSKTSDIEGVLVTGVHGPQQVHVLILEDL